jgi:hypothetical protein
MVAAAGETAGLKPRTAVVCFVALFLSLAAGVYLSIRNSAIEQLGLDPRPRSSPETRELISGFGYNGVGRFLVDFDTTRTSSITSKRMTSRVRTSQASPTSPGTLFQLPAESAIHGG